MGRPRITRELLPNGLPKCVIEGCTRPGQHLGRYRVDGSAIYRQKCTAHHHEQYDMEGGYRVHKKTYCENIDGRLGFVCKTKIVDPCMLTVDHIDNVHTNNNLANLQTLCACCHNYKTRYFGQYTGSYVKKLFEQNRQKI